MTYLQAIALFVLGGVSGMLLTYKMGIRIMKQALDAKVYELRSVHKHGGDTICAEVGVPDGGSIHVKLRDVTQVGEEISNSQPI